MHIDLDLKLKDRKEGPRLCPFCQGGSQLDLFLDFSLDDVPELAF